MIRLSSVPLAVTSALLVFSLSTFIGAQTREKGPWWPSPHGA